MQFVFYTGAASAYLSFLMALSFYQLLMARNAQSHMDHPLYNWVFLMSILAFVEGILFAMFTYEMFSEQIESIEDNQSYIDDLKRQYGMQYPEFMDNCLLTFGEDFLWWGMPIHPELRINYFERVWPKKEIKKMYKTEEFDRNQDHSDPDKKLF